MGVLQIVTEEQLQKREAEQMQEKEVEKKQSSIITSLAGHIDKSWDRAKQAKQEITNRLLEASRQFRSEYEPEKLAAIKQLNGSEIYLPLTNIKCRAAEAWLREVFSMPSSNLFDLSPTPIPDLPDDIEAEIRARLMKAFTMLSQQSLMVQQQTGMPPDPEIMSKVITDLKIKFRDIYKKEIEQKAKKASEEAKELIDDQFIEGGYYKALDECLHDITIYPTTIIKGPEYRKTKVFKREKDVQSGRYTTQVKEEIKEFYKRVSPFNIFPASDSCGINDGDLIELDSITPKDLYDLIGLEGFDEEAVRKVINEYKDGGLKDWALSTTERKEQENKFNTEQSDKLDTLIYWGSVRGELLIEWGMSEEDIPDEEKFYDICAWKIGSHVIKAMLNPDPLGNKPYSKASFIELPDSWWGMSIPEVLSDLQTAANACARGIVNNVGMSSMPVVERNTDRIPAYESKIMYPGKVLDSTDIQMTSAPAYRFYQANLTGDRIMGVLHGFLKMADELSGIPAYAHGDVTVGGAGRSLADYEEVITNNGCVPISSIKIGDKVAGLNGKFYKVTGVYPQGIKEIFRVTFSDGRVVDCTEDHLWIVKTHHKRKFRVEPLKSIIESGLYRSDKSIKSKGYRPKWMVPKPNEIDFPSKSVTIDPYTFGLLIGDGDNRGRLTTMDEEILGYIPYRTGKPDKKEDNKASSYTLLGVRPLYRDYIKGNNKRIPSDYMYNTKQVRIEVLRGLMDTDGCATIDNRTFFCSSSLGLINDVSFLIRSLGGKVHAVTTDTNTVCISKSGVYQRRLSHRIYFNLPQYSVFKLKRKLERVKKIPAKNTYITEISKIENHPATCISVESPDNSYLCANYIPTHNTASGLSMLTQNSSRGIKAVSRNIDRGLIESSVERQYNLNYQLGMFSGDIPDCRVIAKGSINLQEKEMQGMRRTELLQTTMNPIDMQIVGMEGRAELLRDTVKAHGMDEEKIIQGAPSGMPGMPGMSGGPPPQLPANEQGQSNQMAGEVNQFANENGR